MLRNAKKLENYELQARDGSIGHVKDFYFDDRRWNVRYLVVDTGTWLTSRKVLISPLALRAPNWDSRTLPVDLTQEQVRNSPPIDTERPVSRQHETELNRYYGWPYYWSDPAYLGTTGSPLGTSGLGGVPPSTAAPAPAAAARSGVLEDDPHLRSTREVTGYHIEATDGSIGHVEDFLIDDVTWEVRYIIVDTRNWWPGKKVIVAPQWISSVNWSESKVFVDLTRDAIKGSPEYDSSRPLDVDYPERLHDYYGRPRY